VATRLSFFNSLTAHCQSYEEMTLCSLPAEIIAQIVSYLPEDDLQSLYSTCNHQIHSICGVPLQRRKVESAATNTRIIFKLLRTSPQDVTLGWDSTLASRIFKHHRSEFPSHRCWAPSSSDAAIPLDSTEARVQSYLSFNPGPRWLMPADPHLQTSISDYNILYRQQPFHWNQLYWRNVRTARDNLRTPFVDYPVPTNKRRSVLPQRFGARLDGTQVRRLHQIFEFLMNNIPICIQEAHSDRTSVLPSIRTAGCSLPLSSLLAMIR
jgi:hypothetical protein